MLRHSCTAGCQAEPNTDSGHREACFRSCLHSPMASRQELQLRGIELPYLTKVSKSDKGREICKQGGRVRQLRGRANHPSSPTDVAVMRLKSAKAGPCSVGRPISLHGGPAASHREHIELPK